MRKPYFAKAKYWEGFLAGLAIGLFFLLVFVILKEGYERTFEILENYFLGLVAIISALIGGRFLVKQIETMEDHRDDAAFRNSLVGRSVRVNLIIKVMTEIRPHILWLLSRCEGQPVDLSQPRETISKIVETCKYDSDLDVISRAAVISNIFQVLSLRDEGKEKRAQSGDFDTRSRFEDFNTKGLISDAINWLILISALRGMIDQARSLERSTRPERLNVTKDSLENVLDNQWIVSHEVQMAPELTPKLEETVAKREERGQIVPNWMINLDARKSLFI